jgi:hypothetical protein
MLSHKIFKEVNKRGLFVFSFFKMKNENHHIQLEFVLQHKTFVPDEETASCFCIVILGQEVPYSQSSLAV